MDAHIEEYAAGIYKEHLEEASFLYDMRRAFIEDPTRPWRDAGQVEVRLTERLRALTWGGRAAADVYLQRAREGDRGELYAALRAMCRADQTDALVDVLRARCVDHAELAEAAFDALQHEGAGAWQQPVLDAIIAAGGQLWTVAARLAGEHRLPAQRWLVDAVGQSLEQPTAEAVLWAVGRLKLREAGDALFAALQTGSPEARRAAATALLGWGERKALQVCADAAENGWACRCLAMAGGRSAVRDLLRSFGASAPEHEHILALGLLGHIEAVEPLMDCLGESDGASSAALALSLITGAGLYEHVFVAEQINEDELFAEELDELHRTGTVTPKDGESAGHAVDRLAEDPQAWQQWWQGNRGRFNSRTRYRYGHPFSAASLLQTIEAPVCRIELRQLAYEELVIRYGLDVFFSAVATVAAQERFLTEASAWLARTGSRHQAGAWYFAGEPLAE